MSLSNEQRAHDLAIASLPLAQKDSNIMDLYENEAGEPVFDVYKIYLELYNMALVSFDRDFPIN